MYLNARQCYVQVLILGYNGTLYFYFFQSKRLVLCGYTGYSLLAKERRQFQNHTKKKTIPFVWNNYFANTFFDKPRINISTLEFTNATQFRQRVWNMIPILKGNDSVVFILEPNSNIVSVLPSASSSCSLLENTSIPD